MTAIAEPRSKTNISLIPMFRVLIHNDPKTTMEFVVEVLIQFFNKTLTQAAALTMQIHETGVGMAGVYTQEVAELKIEQTVSAARAKGFPLTLSMEKA